MADVETTLAAIRSDFDTRFGALEPTVGRLHDNAPPLSPRPSAAAGDEWVRVMVVLGDATLPEIDSRLSENQGRLVVGIHIPLGVGEARAVAMFDHVRNLYQGLRVGDVKYFETESTFFGATMDNAWFQRTASTRFRFESIPS